MLFVVLLAIAMVAYGVPPNVDLNLAEVYIIGGNAANYDTTRHQIMIQIFYNNEWLFACGGSIIAKTTVLTANHCCDIPGFTTQNMRLLVNEYNMENSTGIPIRIKTIKQHSKSRLRVIVQDICVIQTTEELPSSYIIPLPKKHEDFTGQNCTTSGWGRFETDSWKTATVLQQSWGTIMSTNDCREFYTNFHRKQYAAKLPNDVVTDKSICFAGGPDSTVSTCHGDSGGPLVCNGVLAGVVSWGQRECDPQYPSVFMSVSEHLGWIKAHIKRFDDEQ